MTQALYAHMNNKTIKKKGVSVEKKKQEISNLVTTIIMEGKIVCSQCVFM
jgi:hypothetical protein